MYAIDLERSFLARERLEMQTKLEYLKKCLRSAYREIKGLEQQLKIKNHCIVVGKKRAKEIWDTLELGEMQPEIAKPRGQRPV